MSTAIRTAKSRASSNSQSATTSILIFTLDFDLDPSWMHLDEVCRQADQYGWGGRSAIGHASKLSALDASSLQSVGRRLASAGVAVTVLTGDGSVSDRA
jgi:hypothetical protein